MIGDLQCYRELFIKQTLEHETETIVYLSPDDRIMPLSNFKLNPPVHKIPTLDPLISCPKLQPLQLNHVNTNWTFVQ